VTTATPVADDPLRRERLLARSVTAVAIFAFVSAALGDVAAPLPAGHYASTASVGIVADNMLRWHVPWPVWSYTTGAPTAELAYGHHPWGIFWATTAIFAVFGRSDFACRLAPLVLSTATIPMLYAIGARLHRPMAGAVAAALFAALPISLAFATFNALEVPVIAWSTLALWGFLGLFRGEPRRRDALAFGVGALLACECDWPGFLTSGFLVGGGLVALAARPALREGRPGNLRWAALLATGGAIVAALVVQVAWLRAIGKWDDLLFSYDVRSAGRAAPFWRAIAARRWWLELSFTKLGLALAATGVPLVLWRALRARRPIELAPLALGATAAIQYVVFQQGADVHVFWPQHFTPFVALVGAAWVVTGVELARSRAWIARAVPAIALVAVAWIARDGVAALRYARATGGRFDEKGLLIHSDGDTIAALRTLRSELPNDGVVRLDRGLKPTWSQHFALGRPTENDVGFPDAACTAERRDGSPAAWIADMRFLPAPLLREIATQCATRAIGPVLVVEPGPHRPLEARRLDERAGEGLSGYLRAASEPIRTPAPDPFGTWELRLHLDQLVGDLPSHPRTVDETRIAASARRTGADPSFTGSTNAPWAIPGMRPLDAAFDDGTRIVGMLDARIPGAASLVFIEAAGPLQPGVLLSVVGRVVKPMPLSLTRPDPHRREMAMPSRIPPALWRAGWLYAVEVFVHPRPGVEELRARFVGTGRGRAPRLASNEPDVVLGTHPPR
jgi:hypothetical protein